MKEKIKYMRDIKATLKGGRLLLDQENSENMILLLPGDVKKLRAMLKPDVRCQFITCINIEPYKEGDLLGHQKLRAGDLGVCTKAGISLKTPDDDPEWEDVNFGDAEVGDLLICSEYSRNIVEHGLGYIRGLDDDDPNY